MRYYPNFNDVFDDLFDSGVNTTKANTMLCDIRETENTLSAMIDELEGSEFDMRGLREFKKLLGGE